MRRVVYHAHACSQDVVFERKNKLYVAEWCAEDNVPDAAVQENEWLHTIEEVQQAKLAHELLKNSGYPSFSKAAHLPTNGNIHGIPALMKGDFK
jgi:hypothetical protein